MAGVSTLTPDDIEESKTQQGAKTGNMAANAAYTINHAFLCCITDVIDPFVAAWSQQTFGTPIHTSWCNLTHHHPEPHVHAAPIAPPAASRETLQSLGMGGFGGLADAVENGGTRIPQHHHAAEHDHYHDHAAEHVHHEGDEHTHAGKMSLTSSLKHWLVGEAIGDGGAVFVTLGMEALFPNAMRGLSHAMERVVGGFYAPNTEKDARKWAEKKGYSPYSQECKDYANTLYRYEMDHLGQAGVWMASSIALNVASQKLITHNPLPIPEMLLYKSLGAATTAGLLIGGRGWMPGAFHYADNVTANYLFSPIAGAISAVMPKTPEPVLGETDKQWMGKAQPVSAAQVSHG